MLDLTSSRRKIARARHHLGELGLLCTLMTQPERLQVAPYRREDVAEVGWALAVLESPPDEIAVLLAELVNNLRSALNYVAFQAWHQGGGDLTNRKVRGLVQYPIVREEEKWTAAANRNLPGVRADLIALIRDSQPFNAPESQWLHQLAVLSNEDKHEILHMVVQATAEFSYTYREFPDGLALAMKFSGNLPRLVAGNGYPLCSLFLYRSDDDSLSPIPWPPDVDLDLPAVPQITLGVGGGEVVVPLVDVWDLVHQVGLVLDQIEALPS